MGESNGGQLTHTADIFAGKTTPFLHHSCTDFRFATGADGGSHPSAPTLTLAEGMSNLPNSQEFNSRRVINENN
jgi:hypothetical protein